MLNKDFAAKALSVSKLKTSYLAGGFGCRLGIDWYNDQYAWNRDNATILLERSNTNPLTFGFDCVCLIKGILWGFEDNYDKTYGGSVYESNGVPDCSIETLKKSCPELSTDFDNIEIGEILFLGNSHCGIYIGNGEVIESTPAWKCCVQRTLLPWRNSTNYEKLPVRKWDCHGKIKYIDYSDNSDSSDNSEVEKLKKENAELKEKIESIKKILFG